MAQYYYPWPPCSAASQHFSPRDESSTLELNADTSIYMFPNPSTAPPSPSQMSDLSIPTDITVSAFSETSSRYRSKAHSPALVSKNVNRANDVSERLGIGPWEWPEDITFSEFRVKVSEREREAKKSRERPHLRHSLKTSPSFTAAIRNRRFVTPPGRKNDKTSLHPHFRIPLLSFFISLLQTDASTVDVLTHSNSRTFLFPGQFVDSTIDSEQYLIEKCGEMHGIQKLLLTLDDSQMEANSEFTLTFRLSDIWSIGTLVSHSGKALRQVFRASA